MSALDLSKPYRQRVGRAARVIATDLDDPEYPLVVAYRNRYGREVVDSFTRDGRWLAGHTNDQDLVNFEEGASDV
jgi:hypothetical protein